MQSFDVAWDSRSKEHDGQRWFHLYPDQLTHYRGKPSGKLRVAGTNSEGGKARNGMTSRIAHHPLITLIKYVISASTSAGLSNVLATSSRTNSR